MLLSATDRALALLFGTCNAKSIVKTWTIVVVHMRIWVDIRAELLFLLLLLW